MSDPGTTSGSAGDPRALSALRLRQLAENAAGYNDQPMVLAFLPPAGTDPGGWNLCRPDDDRLPNAEVSVPVNQEIIRPNSVWKKPDKVAVVVGRKEIVLTDNCDAFFWSHSAAEKFVTRYYLPLMEGEKWKHFSARLNGEIGGPAIYGIEHTYPSIPDILDDTTVHTEAGPQKLSQFLEESTQLFMARFAPA